MPQVSGSEQRMVISAYIQHVESAKTVSWKCHYFHGTTTTTKAATKAGELLHSRMIWLTLLSVNHVNFEYVEFH
jgi:hypothetical protein